MCLQDGRPLCLSVKKLIILYLLTKEHLVGLVRVGYDVIKNQSHFCKRSLFSLRTSDILKWIHSYIAV